MEELIMLRTNFIPKAGKFRVIYTVKEENKDLTAEIFVLFERNNNKMYMRSVVLKRNIHDNNALASFNDANDTLNYKTEFVNADIYPFVYENIEHLLQEHDINISRAEIDLGILQNYNITVLMDVKKRFPDVFSTLEKLTKSTILKQFIDLAIRHTPPQIEEIS